MFSNTAFRAPARRTVAAALTLTLAAAAFLVPQVSPSAAAATLPTGSTASGALTSATARSWARTMLGQLNAERAAHHRKALKMNVKLISSAHTHNLAMAAADTMSHQLPRESYFATRIERAGYNWLYAGENIGYSTVQSASGLLELQTEMYNEKAPDDGHRVNILNKHYKQVGIDVYFDAAHQTMWFTQDFGRTA